MVTILVEVFGLELQEAFESVVAVVSVVSAVALLAWAGYRLGAKMINRGVGK